MNEGRTSVELDGLADRLARRSALLRDLRRQAFGLSAISAALAEVDPSTPPLTDQDLEALAFRLRLFPRPTPEDLDSIVARRVSRDPDDTFNFTRRCLVASPEEGRELVATWLPELAADPQRLPKVLHSLLKAWSAEPEARGPWHQLSSARPDQGKRNVEKPQRDQLVLDLLRKITAFDVGGTSWLVHEMKRPLGYYQSHFFDWFLGRYDLHRARSVYATKGRDWALCAPVYLLPVLLLVAGLATLELVTYVFVAAIVPLSYTLVIAFLAIAMSGGNDRSRLRPILAVSSLVPRLAGSVFVGMFVIVSSQQLASFVSMSNGPNWPQKLLAVAALVGGLLYLAVEISRKVHPPLNLADLLRRTAEVASVGFSHALGLALIAFPVVHYVASFEKDATFSLVFEPQLWPLVSVVAYASAIGLVLTVIWAEEPVTEPL